MKKSIAILALSASSTSAMALVAPGETKLICLRAITDADGTMYGGSCDESQNNVTLQLPILANGCAENQIAITASKFRGGEFDVQVQACLPPNVVQL